MFYLKHFFIMLRLKHAIGKTEKLFNATFTWEQFKDLKISLHENGSKKEILNFSGS